MYPLCSHTNNLQKVEIRLFVKDNVISAMPNFPTDSQNPHTRILALVSLSILFNQLSNTLVIFAGSGIL
jgi:hypothetical protein